VLERFNIDTMARAVSRIYDQTIAAFRERLRVLRRREENLPGKPRVSGN